MVLRDHAPGEVSIRLGYPTNSHRKDRYAVLEVTDSASGYPILEVELSADLLLKLLSSSPVYAVARVLVPRPERVGKVLDTINTTIRYGEVAHGGPTLNERAEAVADGYRANGYEASIRGTRDGVNVTAKRWVDPPVV